MKKIIFTMVLIAYSYASSPLKINTNNNLKKITILENGDQNIVIPDTNNNIYKIEFDFKIYKSPHTLKTEFERLKNKKELDFSDLEKNKPMNIDLLLHNLKDGIFDTFSKTFLINARHISTLFMDLNEMNDAHFLKWLGIVESMNNLQSLTLNRLPTNFIVIDEINQLISSLSNLHTLILMDAQSLQTQTIESSINEKSVSPAMVEFDYGEKLINDKWGDASIHVVQTPSNNQWNKKFQHAFNTLLNNCIHLNKIKKLDLRSINLKKAPHIFNKCVELLNPEFTDEKSSNLNNEKKSTIKTTLIYQMDYINKIQKDNLEKLAQSNSKFEIFFQD
jgi:hypothetical protein